MDNHEERHVATPNVVIDYIRETDTIRITLIDRVLTDKELDTLLRAGYSCVRCFIENALGEMEPMPVFEAPYSERAQKEAVNMFPAEHTSQDFYDKVKGVRV